MTDSRLLTLHSLAHSGVDFYQGAIAALLPFFVLERGYGYAAVSGVVLVSSLLSSLSQPLFGLLADRRKVLWLTPVSIVTSGAGITLCGLATSYGTTLAAVALTGIGVAAYHPVAAQTARTLSGGRDRPMSWFSVGGNIGFAVSPLVVAGVMSLGGLAATPLLIIPAVCACLLSMPALKTLAERDKRAPMGSPTTRMPDHWSAFGRLSIVIVCRSVVVVGLSSFVALLAQGKLGLSAEGSAGALFALYAGGMVGTVTGGVLAVRWGRIPVIRWSYIVSVAVIAAILVVPGWTIFPLVFAAGLFLYVPFSLQLTLAQDYLPNHIGTASGIALGLAASVGGMVAPVIGVIADANSLSLALVPLAGIPLIAVVIMRGLGDPRRDRARHRSTDSTGERYS